MSETATAQSRQTEAKKTTQRDAPQGRIAELRVSGHLMTLDSGLFCITVGGQASAPHNGLPGVRLSPPPGSAGRPHSVSISTFREDGWLAGGDAALVRISDGPAQIMVTVYQAPDAGPDQAPRLSVMPLGAGSPGPAVRPAQPQQPGAERAAELPEVVAHIQRMGDVAGAIGEWMGTRGSRLWIEGFGLAPQKGLASVDIEYQAVLGKDWLSPWVEGGKFCGSRGMALPVLGLTVRLKGRAAATHDLSYSATFVDGTSVGPVPAGEPCQAESLAALEAFQIVLRPKSGAARAAPAAPAAPAAKPQASSRGSRASTAAKKPARRR